MTGLVSTSTLLPSALEHREEIKQKLLSGSLAVFSDYDGTLTPIVARPELAVLDSNMRDTLTELAQKCPVGIVSGRALSDVRQLVGLDNVYYAGNHGLQVMGPEDSGVQFTRGEEFIAELAEVKHELTAALGAISGVLLEDKQLSLSVHYRQAPATAVDAIEQAVDSALAARPGLRKHNGKKVFEVRPAVDWHKGYVVDWLVEILAPAGATAVYLGDDVTDEDAFKAVASTGIGIRVGAADADSAAHYCLRDPGEVRQFLSWLSQQLERRP